MSAHGAASSAWNVGGGDVPSADLDQLSHQVIDMGAIPPMARGNEMPPLN